MAEYSIYIICISIIQQEARGTTTTTTTSTKSIYRHCQCAALFILMCLFFCPENDKDSRHVVRMLNKDGQTLLKVSGFLYADSCFQARQKRVLSSGNLVLMDSRVEMARCLPAKEKVDNLVDCGLWVLFCFSICGMFRQQD